MIKLIKHNPYRTLGVLSNTPLRERIANQNKLNAFAKIGKSVIFPYDFDGIIEEVPLRTPENIAAAITAINLDSYQLKHSLFWFINASPIDGVALKYFEFGQEHPELMVMLHGGVCYRGALPVAEEMAKTYGRRWRQSVGITCREGENHEL